MENREIRIYTASKTKHAHIWRDLRRQGHNIISSWIDVQEVVDRRELAIKCVEESRLADVCLLYCEKDELLKDAIVEYGIALGAGKKVVIVGECLTLGDTLKLHPNVTIADGLMDAFQKIYNSQTSTDGK